MIPGGQRHAARFNAVEVNSSFYQPHPSATQARWTASVPEHLRFSVKLPGALTHPQRLADCAVLPDGTLYTVQVPARR
ncbi:DUF72 domain-containing protein [Polaromonas sp.]|uniref:DUF72 domain-containing protein n=1 Tax=Polaromonas sp. TaxID=1869339 RepID=UPI0025CEC99B|nr:DUF72 domain-containing protein [Polaromonas sp.]